METRTVVSWVVVIILVALGVFILMRESNNEVPSNMMPTQDSSDAKEMIDERMEDGVIENDGNIIKENGTTGDTVTVTYTDDGFFPKEVTVKKGDVVKFVNNASGGMWVGSAIHPTHSQYPIKTESDCLGSAFDQCVASDPGTSWEFKFDAVGSHGYHNHVRASHFGKIIVQ
jgi:plastocyanin